MKLSLREILVDSRVAAVAVAVLLLFSMDSSFRALWSPLFRVDSFVFTTVAILGVPYFDRGLRIADRFMMLTTFSYLCSSASSLGSAWLLSHWVYGVGPLDCLRAERTKLARRNHV